MPVKSLVDISGGKTNRPPRTSPQNTVDDIVNVIANVDNFALVTCPLLTALFSTAYPYSQYSVIAATIIKIEETNDKLILFAIGTSGDGYYRIFGYNGSFYSPVSELVYCGDGTLPLTLLKSRSGSIFHNACDESKTYFNNKYIRKLFGNGDYRKFYEAVGTNEEYQWRELPNVLFDLEYFYSFAFKDLSFGDFFNSYNISENEYLLKFGVNFDNVQSITTKFDSYEYDNTIFAGTGLRLKTNRLYKRFTAEGTNSGLIKVNIKINPSEIEERITGIDIYLAEVGASDVGYLTDSDNLNWRYIETIDFDHESTIWSFSLVDLDTYLTDTAGDEKVLNMSPADFFYFSNDGMTSNLVIEFIDSSGTSREYKTLSNASDYGESCIVFIGDSYAGLTGIQDVKVKSKWIADGDYYIISKFLNDITGESLIDRCGVSDRKIVDIQDYCPPAFHCVNFKGFIWLGDYFEYGETRRRNRMIHNSINSDGNSCHDIYDVNIYFEFESDIVSMIPLKDYMLVFTEDGIYSVTFVPPTGTYSETWSVKKISEITIRHKKMISFDGNVCMFSDYNDIFLSDGMQIKRITDDEQTAIIKENITTANKDNLEYSILYNSKNESILLFLDNILRFKNGIFEYSVDSGSYLTMNDQYEDGYIVFIDGKASEISNLNDSGIVDEFNITSYNDDLGTKEDKILNEIVMYVEKSENGGFRLSIYLDDVVVKEYDFINGISFADQITIRPPKSKRRTFKKIKYAIELVSDRGTFKLQYCDVDFDVVRKTIIGEENG